MTWITATTISITVAHDTARIGGTFSGVNINITRVEAGSNRRFGTSPYNSTTITRRSLYLDSSTV